MATVEAAQCDRCKRVERIDEETCRFAERKKLPGGWGTVTLAWADGTGRAEIIELCGDCFAEAVRSVARPEPKRLEAPAP